MKKANRNNTCLGQIVLFQLYYLEFPDHYCLIQLHGHRMSYFLFNFSYFIFSYLIFVTFQVGTYFNFIMGMVASSVVLTVIVLNYHHRCDGNVYHDDQNQSKQSKKGKKLLYFLKSGGQKSLQKIFVNNLSCIS